MVLGLVVFISMTALPAQGSMNSKIDFSDPRIAAVFVGSKENHTAVANASAYFYSSRIVFSAGHLDSTAKFSTLYIGQPNKKLNQSMKYAKVIKTYFPKSFDKGAYSNDFAIFVLDKPLSNLGKAELITEEKLQRVITEKIPVKILGYGVYKDACKLFNQKPRCNVDGAGTSTTPRSITMNPVSYSSLKSTFGDLPNLSKVKDHLFLESDFYTGPCPGDSGGSSTATIDGVNYYLGTTPAGFWGGYSCGQTSEKSDTLGYSAPVYKFLDLIKQAEEFVATHKVK
jgi:hypothetical protein